MNRSILVSLAAVAALCVSACQAQMVRSAQGAGAAAVQGAVDQFRADLGVNNAVGPCVGGCLPGVGRREVNWDAVPDSFASPNVFPGDFFGQALGAPAGRIRGINFSTAPGATFEVSSNILSGVPVLFGNRSANNPQQFEAFSPERIFGVNGLPQLDVRFSVPGDPGTTGLVRGFGVVFTDVEVAGAAKLDFYDQQDNLLFSAAAEPFPLNGAGDTFKSFSFLGVSFADPVVARVRVTSGDYNLSFQQLGSVNDAVAMDDFIFGEPVAVPEPATLALGLLVAATFLGASRRR